MLFGNGGSAALASHLVADFQKSILRETGMPFECLSLTDNVPLLTAWANDTDYQYVFEQQARIWVRKGDVVLAISGSGNSLNVLDAVDLAYDREAFVLGLTGMGGGKLVSLCNYVIVVPSQDLQTVEDCHVAIGHALFRGVLQELKTSEEANDA